jgi:N-acetylglucosaminyl-diphospho-decaprenol L-rhamnosyltransferase
LAGDRVATILVAYESADVLPATLASVQAQLEPGDELVVVDNASSDDSRAVAARLGAAVVPLTANTGFAHGTGAGVRATSAPLLLLLNPDTVLRPGALAALRAQAAAEPRWGAWQALVLLPGGERINTAGNVAHWLGIGWAGDCDRPVSAAPPAPKTVSFASGAALMVRRAAWDAVGGFPDEYFMYAEDLDLSLRLRLAGWEVGVVPGAQAEHDYAFLKGQYKWFLLERNRWWTVLADYPGRLLALVLPPLLAAEIALLAVAAREGWLPAKLRAQLAVLRSLPWALRRRARVQAGARISPAAFAAGLSASLDSPYLTGIARNQRLSALQAGYWQLVLRTLERAR